MSDELFFGLTEKEVEEHTALSVASEVIINLRTLVEITQGNGEGAFYKQFGNYVRENHIVFRDQDKLDAQKPIFIDQSPEVWARERNSFYIFAATVFAFDAIEEYTANRTQHAWILATKSACFLGLAAGSDAAIVTPRIVKSDQARQNKYKSDEKNRKRASDVLKYYQNNIGTFSSMDDAAEKIEVIQEQKGEKRAYKSIRKDLTKFHKENPSIPKPSHGKKQ